MRKTPQTAREHVDFDFSPKTKMNLFQRCEYLVRFGETKGEDTDRTKNIQKTKSDTTIERNRVALNEIYVYAMRKHIQVTIQLHFEPIPLMLLLFPFVVCLLIFLRSLSSHARFALFSPLAKLQRRKDRQTESVEK